MHPKNRISSIKNLLLFFVLLPISFISMYGQEDQPEKIKIGLVLSGGGAKGLAHIGALEVIEESGVQIDYIGGTSMGAIIGSLYASGYSAKQLDSIFRTTNFRKLIRDDLPRSTKNHYEKEGAQRYLITLPFDNFKIKFPSGLSKGQNLYNLFSQLMYPVKDIDDFGALPIPFFCIGTNIETGEKVVLETGSLPQAVAASASLPSLFTPVIVDNKLISDGGIVDNYPIEELKKRGMNYIIGIDVQDSLVGRDKLGSAFKIMGQVSNFPTIKAMRTKREETDLYIHPDITYFSVLSFDKGNEIVAAGKKATAKLKGTLDSLAQLQIEPVRKRGVKIPDSLRIKEIKITGNEHFKRSYIRGKLKIPQNEKISYITFNEGINSLSATKDFERIQYELVSREDEGDDLHLNLTETSGRTVLQLGLHYDGLYEGAGIVNLTHKRFLFPSDRISTDLIAGRNFRYRVDYFIDKGDYWSFGINSSFTQFDQSIRPEIISRNTDFWENPNKIRLDYVDWTQQIYVETFFLNRNALRFRMGWEHKYVKLKTGTFVQIEESSTPNLLSLQDSGHAFGPYGFLEYDSYDHPYFPTKGSYFKASLHNYLFKSGFTIPFDRVSVTNAQLGFAFSLSPTLSVQTDAYMGLQFGPSEWKALDYYLGGYGNNFVNNIVPFFGYSFLSETGNSVFTSSIKLDYHPFPKHHFMLGYNIANIGDDLYKNGKAFNLPDYSAFYTGFGWESLLGPLEIYYSFSPEITKSRWFISFGLWF